MARSNTIENRLKKFASSIIKDAPPLSKEEYQQAIDVARTDGDVELRLFDVFLSDPQNEIFTFEEFKNSLVADLLLKLIYVAATGIGLIPLIKGQKQLPAQRHVTGRLSTHRFNFYCNSLISNSVAIKLGNFVRVNLPNLNHSSVAYNFVHDMIRQTRILGQNIANRSLSADSAKTIHKLFLHKSAAVHRKAGNADYMNEEDKSLEVWNGIVNQIKEK